MKGAVKVRKEIAMPKERIHGEPRNEEYGTIDVVVQWGKPPMVTDLRIKAPGYVAVSLQEQGVDEGDTVKAYSFLDRGSINKLIRDLRRAREAAYGKDE